MRGRVAWLVVSAAACGRIGFDPLGAADDGPGGSGSGSDGYGGVFANGNLVFVTSDVRAPGSFGSLTGADDMCMQSAAMGGLTGTFVAYLSTSTVDAPDRLAGASGWIRRDGKIVAHVAGEFVDGRMLHPIRITEQNTSTPDLPTESVTTGTFNGQALDHCNDYSSTTASGGYGMPQYAGGLWEWRQAGACSVARRLYCFQIDGGQIALPIIPATGRLAFVSTTAFDPGAGLAMADSICRMDALGEPKAAGRTFQALLPSNGTSAADRFDASDGTQPWVRLDGIPLAATARDFLEGRSDAALNVTATGTIYNDYVITGARNATDIASPCSNWSSTSGSGNWHGESDGTGGSTFDQTSASCSAQYPIYCLEP